MIKCVILHIINTYGLIFKRKLSEELVAWKDNPRKKPLLVMGARQVGKTTLIQYFGAENYEDVVYFNFELNPEIHEFFKLNKDPKRIIQSLSLFHQRPISTDTLIIFDEIQECPEALTSLKYFAEQFDKKDQRYDIIAAGSLLGITLGQTRSFPVGKVEFLDLHPLTFEEYLSSTDSKLYRTYLHFLEQSGFSKIPDAFFMPLMDSFKKYMVCGGMPEAAAYYHQELDHTGTKKIQDQILQSYSLDFTKHMKPVQSNRIQYVWNSIPSQLAKENRKFVYRVIKQGARAREYEAAITWLEQAGLIYKVYNITNANIPLKAYRDLSNFKIYLHDIGLLMRMSGIDLRSHLIGNELFREFKGAFTENYVAQSLANQLGYEPSFWTSGRAAEIDFIIQEGGNVIPIEFKSGKSTRSKSLKVYNQKYQPLKRVRISPLNFHQEGTFINVPIFYTDNVLEIIKKV